MRKRTRQTQVWVFELDSETRAWHLRGKTKRIVRANVMMCMTLCTWTGLRKRSLGDTRSRAHNETTEQWYKHLYNLSRSASTVRIFRRNDVRQRDPYWYILLRLRCSRKRSAGVSDRPRSAAIHAVYPVVHKCSYKRCPVVNRTRVSKCIHAWVCMCACTIVL
jgi:hypothetical protein